MPKNIAIKVARAEKDMTQKSAGRSGWRITPNCKCHLKKGEYNPTIKLCREKFAGYLNKKFR